MVAAYLVGTRGSVRDAVVLGGTVTIAHTAGVIALGVIALALSQWILPEQLYPWLNLVAGLMVVTVGIQVLRRRLKARAHEHAHHHGHHHHHHHEHEHRGSMLALGASAGLIPCPSALVVLLGAISQHRLVLGLVLILAFSAGLATTLTSIGIAVVKASQRLGRMRMPDFMPALSAALIVVIGAVLTAKAVPTL
jgi:ABC-type nickel/cobalt efflux system permease component RcnA